MSQARDSELLADWRALSRALPDHHEALTAGRSEDFEAAVASLPAIEAEALALLDDESALLAALDVLMVEASARRHGLPIEGNALEASARAVAARSGLQPILSYPLYIRNNPPEIDRIRRFTRLEAEYRFIRMHAAIEDRFDELIERLERIFDSREPRLAFRDHHPALLEGLRSCNRIMSGFRSPVRMPHEDFYEGFRPYYDARYDRQSGDLLLEGPSGLQSFTYRIIAMQLGYRDRMLDGWTRRIGHYHPPAVRERLARVMDARDAGRNLCATVADPILGARPGLPRLHPAYASHLPALISLAERGGFVAADVLPSLVAHGLQLGQWPAEMPPRPEVAPVEPPVGLDDQDRADLSRLAELEAALVGMHLEHAATAAEQIGAARGTGGTSGVEFLLVATFRRAFPALWQSGLGEELASELAGKRPPRAAAAGR